MSASQRNSSQRNWFSAFWLLGAATCALPEVQAQAQTKENTPAIRSESDAAREKVQERVKELIAESTKLYYGDQYSESLRVLKEVLKLQQEHLYPQEQFPKGSTDLGMTYFLLGQCFGQLRDRAQSMQNYESAVAILREFPDAAHYHIDCLTRLAATQSELRDYAKAEANLDEARKACQRLYPMEDFPDGHPAMANVEHRYGQLYQSQGRWDAAITRYENAIRICRVFCGKHPERRGGFEIETAYDVFARSLRDLAQVRTYLGQLTEAVASLEERIKIQRVMYSGQNVPGNQGMLGETLQLTALIYLRQTRYVEATKLLEEALAIADNLAKSGHNSERLAVQCLCDLARVSEYQGRLDVAIERSNAALERSRRMYSAHPTDNHRAFVAFANRTSGQVLSKAGELDQARNRLEEAISILRALDEKKTLGDQQRMIAIALYQLGEVWRQQGEYGRAKECLVESAAILRRLFPDDKYPDGHPEVATSLCSLGNIYFEMHDRDKAFEELERAEQIWEKLAKVDEKRIDRRARAITLGKIAEVYWKRGDLENAKKNLDRSYGMLEALFPPEHYPHGHADLAALLAHRARLHGSSGNTAEAVECTTLALNMAHRLYPEELLPHGHELTVSLFEQHADALLAHGDHGASAEAAFRAVEMNQEIGGQIIPGLSEAECLNYVSENLKLPAALVPAWQLARRPVAELYELVWKQRAVVLRTIEARQFAARRSQDPAIAALLEQQRINARRLGGLMRFSLDIAAAAPVTSINEELSQLTNRKEQLERELSRKIPHDLERSDRFRVTPADLEHNLPGSSAYVEFLVYPTLDPGGQKTSMRLAAFVVQPHASIRFHDLGLLRNIEAAVIQFRKEIIDNRNELTAGIQLREILWAPLEATLAPDVTAIYLCPDGVLTAIPWAAIPGKQPNSILLHDYALSVVPCGQYLCNWLASPKKDPSAKSSLLAVGDVNYNEPGESDNQGEKNKNSMPLALAVRGDEPFAFGPLSGTSDELDYLTGIVKEPNVIVLRGSRANTRNVLEELPNVRWAHFATHGFFANARIRSALQDAVGAEGSDRFQSVRRNDSPARSPLVLSGLVLAGANVARGPADAPQQDDGILTGETISQLPLENLDLAILSACETGLGDVAGGEGVLGLQRAFHMAGARNVIASLWKIDDRATAVLMQLVYYKLIHDRKPIAQALREAQLALYDHPELLDESGELRGRIDFTKTVPVNENDNGSSSDNKSHPRLWAAFVLSGAGT